MGKLVQFVLGESGGEGSHLSRHYDVVLKRLNELFDFLVCPFISCARRLSEVLLPAEIDSAMEGLQVPVKRSVVFFTRFIEQRLVCFCRLSVAKHSAKAEHDQRTVNLHHVIPTGWNEARAENECGQHTSGG